LNLFTRVFPLKSGFTAQIVLYSGGDKLQRPEYGQTQIVWEAQHVSADEEAALKYANDTLAIGLAKLFEEL
jgi:hypothetical protein